MNAFTRFYKSNLPGPLTEAFTWFQLNLAPARFFRQRKAILRQAGSPQSVIGGPFKGMVYARHAADKCLLPRLFGTYECELHKAVEQLCAARPDVVVVAGSGEGYYAVGLARRISNAKVFAYDGFRWARYLLGQMAGRNGVLNRVQIGGLLTPPELERVLVKAKNPAFICDVEGYEIELLDFRSVPSLARTTILLELHDYAVPGLTNEISRRFRPTHQLEFIRQRPRTLSDLPPGVSLNEKNAHWAMNEMLFRTVEQTWLCLTPIIASSTR